jgi:hypothetical protein
MPEEPSQNPQARTEIPEAWGKSGHCPACNTAPLQVVHLDAGADYLLCEKCELSFEIADSGGRIRVKNIPDTLGFAEEQLRFRWVKPGFLQILIKERSAGLAPTSPVPQAANPSPPMLTDLDVWERTLSLYKIGNSDRKIKYILLQAGASEKQTKSALEYLKKHIAKESQQQSKKLLWLGSVVVMIFALIFGSTLGFRGQIAARLAAGDTASNTPILPMRDAAELLPDFVKPEFLKSEPAKVSSSGPTSGRCPSNNQDAAKLFGGKAEAWSPGNQPKSWQMIDTGNPVTVRVPGGMVAGYIDNTTFMFYSANGPSTIQNVNFLVIVCD